MTVTASGVRCCLVLLALAACGEPSDPNAIPEARIVFRREALLYSMRPDGTDQRRISPPVDSGPLGPIAWLLPVSNAAGTRIAFEYDGDIRTLTPAGTGLTNVTSDGFVTPELWPSWSPDGERLAYDNGVVDGADIFVMDTHGGQRVRVTTNPADDREPAWAPDGSRIAFTSSRDSVYGIYTIGPSGEQPRRITPYSVTAVAPVWSPAGDMIAFFGYDSVGQGLYVIGADGGGLRELAGTYNGYGRATWSPDGKRLAYSANVGQQSKIFVINGDGTNLSVLSPPEAADYDPAWVPAGR